jgi:hypothetical protein
MAANYDANNPLHESFRDWMMLSSLRELAKENPSVAQAIWDGTADAPQLLAEYNNKIAQQMKASLPTRADKKPVPAPASKPNGRRPFFDENGTTTAAVKAILRSK